MTSGECRACPRWRSPGPGLSDLVWPGTWPLHITGATLSSKLYRCHRCPITTISSPKHGLQRLTAAYGTRESTVDIILSNGPPLPSLSCFARDCLSPRLSSQASPRLSSPRPNPPRPSLPREPSPRRLAPARPSGAPAGEIYPALRTRARAWPPIVLDVSMTTTRGPSSPRSIAISPRFSDSPPRPPPLPPCALAHGPRQHPSPQTGPPRAASAHVLPRSSSAPAPLGPRR